jgi:chemotaxis protein CheD
MMGMAMPPAEEPASVYLHPGQIFVSATACRISTIVGSCVTVCIFDSFARLGGANHYLLAEAFADPAQPNRFGSNAVPELVARALHLGGRRSDLVAKIFGGAAMNVAAPHETRETLGAKNVTLARRILEKERIPVVAEDVGGSRGRKVIFSTDEGHVWVRRL